VTDGSAFIAGATGVDVNHLSAGAAYFFDPIEIDPSLTAIGECPGEVEVAAVAGTPFASSELWYGTVGGTTVLEAEPCIGLEIPLGGAAALRTGAAGEGGGRSIVRSTREGQCDIELVWLDLTTCKISNLVSMP